MALVNCLNFGNPEHPEVMWQLSESVDGMAEACRALGIPVIGGNVRLYNESAGRDIDPTPVVAVLGLVEELRRRPPAAVLEPEASLVVLGPRVGADQRGALDGSAWAARRGHRGGTLAPLDYAAHTDVLLLVRQLVADGTVTGASDVSDGGLALALAEMAVASGTGFHITQVRGHAELFSELPSRVVLCTSHHAAVLERAAAAGVEAAALGTTGGRRMIVDGAGGERLLDLGVDDAVARWRGALDPR